MDLKQIERLMSAMGRNGMKKVVIKQEGLELELEKESPFGAPMQAMPPQQRYEAHPHHLPHAPPGFPEEKKGAPDAKESKFITSPMVGTFYSAPSPDDPAYIKVGDQVDPNSVVCIVEAMKVMNEVKAGQSGVVAEILLRNGDPVEFGTKIIRLG